MRTSIRFLPLLITALPFILGAAFPRPAAGQMGAAREGIEAILESVARYFGKRSVREGAEELADYGGEALARRLANTLVRDGGEDALEEVALLARRYGPDALRALNHTPAPKSLLRDLAELPADQVGPALRRLTAESAGPNLAALTRRYGSLVLRAELKHPGVARRLVEPLGKDGALLALRLNRDEAISLARHAADIQRLPKAQRDGVLRLLYRDTKGMVRFLGDFVQRHPGKTLFTAATTAVILAHPDRILGGDAEIVFDSQGRPHVVAKQGLIGRTIDRLGKTVLEPVLRVLLPILAAGAALWLALKLWAAYRLQRYKLRVQQEAARQKADHPRAH